LVSLSDSSQKPKPTLSPLIGQLYNLGSQAVLGDFLALISALFYALYATLLKVRIRSESRIDMQLFFGFVGLHNLLICWILGAILHLTGIENFELPSTRAEIGAILLNMFVTFSSDYLYVKAMLKTTPLVATIGLSLTIPLAVVGDTFLGKPSPALVLFGAFLVSVAFFMVGLSDGNTTSKDDELRETIIVERVE